MWTGGSDLFFPRSEGLLSDSRFMPLVTDLNPPVMYLRFGVVIIVDTLISEVLHLLCYVSEEITITGRNSYCILRSRCQRTDPSYSPIPSFFAAECTYNHLHFTLTTTLIVRILSSPKITLSQLLFLGSSRQLISHRLDIKIHRY